MIFGSSEKNFSMDWKIVGRRVDIMYFHINIVQHKK